MACVQQTMNEHQTVACVVSLNGVQFLSTVINTTLGITSRRCSILMMLAE